MKNIGRLNIMKSNRSNSSISSMNGSSSNSSSNNMNCYQQQQQQLTASDNLWSSRDSSMSSREGTPNSYRGTPVIFKNAIDELPDRAVGHRKLSLKGQSSSNCSDAIREAAYIGSFPVDEPTQEARADYIKKHLSDMRNISSAKPVLLAISLSGIKVCCGSGETVFMAHALKRISYATCQPEKCQFSFLAREPKSPTSIQYCHTFVTKTSTEAEEINSIVANAFKTAYQQQQQQQQQQQLNSSNNNISTSFNDLIQSQINQQQREHQLANQMKEERLKDQLNCISTPRIDSIGQERKMRRMSRLISNEDEDALEWARNMVDKIMMTTTTSSMSNNNNHHDSNSIDDNNNSNIHDLLNSLSNNSNNSSNNITNSSCNNNTSSPVNLIKKFIDNNFDKLFTSDSSTITIIPSSKHSSSHQLNSLHQHLAQPEELSPIESSDWSPIRSHQPIGTSHSMVTMATNESRSSNVNEERPSHIEHLAREYLNKSGRPEADVNDSKLHEQPWYQPGVPRDIALNQLLHQVNGSFVVRDSSTHPNCYALSIKVPKYDSPNEITHYLIVKTPRGTFKIKGLTKEWTSLTSLVLHHTIMRELLPCLLVLP